MPGLVLKLDTSQAAASTQDLRKNLKSLGATSQMAEDQIKSLEQKMLRGMGADAAKAAIEEVARSTKMTAMEMQRFQKQVGDVSGRIDTLKGHFTGLASKVNNFKNLFIGAAAALGTFKLGSSFIQTASMFEGFNASLLTITGSASKAEKAMSWIQEFTAKTPYELQEVTSNFIKLSNYGLEAKRVMGLLGNTAGAMGKSLSQVTEALADAVAGENERLKEFGVKTKKQGENVTYTWTEMGKQMTHTTKLTSENVIQAFEKIFARFKGGMDRQSKTWAGMMSNMKDHWTLFVKDIMFESDLFDILKEKLYSVLSTIDKLKKEGKLKEWAKQIGQAIIVLGDALERVAKVAIVGGLLFAISQIPAAIALAEVAMIKFNMSLYAGEVQAIATAGGITTLKGTLNVLMAAFAGWQIGQWLYDNFEWARLAGLAFVDAIMRGWIEIKHGALIMIAGFRDAWVASMKAMSSMFTKWLEWVASGIEKVPGLGGLADDLKFDAARLKAEKALFKGVSESISEARGQYQAALKEHDATIEAIRKEHIGYKETTKAAKESGDTGKESGEKTTDAANGAAKAIKGSAKAAKDAQREYEQLAQKADQLYQQLYQGQKGKTKAWYDYELEGIKEYQKEAESVFKKLSESGELSAQQRLLIEEDYQEKVRGLFEETLNTAIEVNQEEVDEFDEMLKEISDNRQGFFGDDLSDYKNHLGDLEVKLEEHVKTVLGIEELSAEQRMAIKEKMAVFEEKLNRETIETEKERQRVLESFYNEQGARSIEYLEIQAKKIDERAEQLRAAGVEEIEIQEWVNDEIIKLNEERYDAMYSTSNDFFDQLTGLLTGEVKDWKSALGSLANSFMSMFSDLSAAGQQRNGGGFWSGLAGLFGGGSGGSGGGGGSWLGSAADWIGGLFGGSGGSGGGSWLGSAADWVGGLFGGGGGSGGGSWLGSAADWVGGLFDGGGGGVLDSVGSAIGTATDWVGSLTSGLTGAGAAAGNAAVGAIEAGTGAIANNAGNAVGNAAGSALSSYSSYIGGAINLGSSLLSGDNPFENQYGNEALGVVQAIGQFSKYGAILSTAGEWLGGLVGEEGAQIGSGIGAGAGAGATIGSFFPGPGTAIGAAVGAIVGGVSAAFGLDSQKDFKVGIHKGDSNFFEDITNQGYWDKRGGNEEVRKGLEEMVKQTQQVVWQGVDEVTTALPEGVRDEFNQVLSNQKIETMTEGIFVRQSYLQEDMERAQKNIIDGMWGATVPAFQAVADDIIGQFDPEDVQNFGMGGLAEQIRQGPQYKTFEIEDEEGNITEETQLDVQGYLATISQFETGMEQMQTYMDELTTSIEDAVGSMFDETPKITEYETAVSELNGQFDQIGAQMQALGAVTGLNIDLSEQRTAAIEKLNEKFAEARQEIMLQAEAMAGHNVAMTEYDARMDEVNAGFDELAEGLRQAGASADELTAMEALRTEAMQYEMNIFREQRAELLAAAEEMAGINIEANTDMFASAKDYINEFFDDLMAQYVQLGASASELAQIEGMRHQALVQQLQGVIFPEINSNSIASLFSDAIQAAVDRVEEGGEVDYSEIGTKINQRIADAMKTSVINLGIGQVAETIQNQMIAPFMNNIIQGFLGQGFNLETIQKSFKDLQNLNLDKVSGGVTELFTALTTGEEINWEEFVEKYGSELETAFGDLAAMEPDPLEMQAPEYQLPESYDTTVFASPPNYEISGGYDTTVYIDPPDVQVSGEPMATGKWNVPLDGFPAILHQGEAVIRKEDAPLIRSVLAATGRAGKYGANGSSIGGIQSYASGSLRVWESGNWFTGIEENVDEMADSMDSAANSASGFSNSFSSASSSMENTTDQLRKIWDDFRDIQFTDLAPVQSAEQYAFEYQKLLADAKVGGEEEYRELADFSKSTLLPFMETYSDVDYKDVYNKVFSDVGSVHGFIQEDGMPTDDIIPTSLLASSAQRSEDDGDAIAERVGNAVSVALMDSQPTQTSGGGELVVKVYIDGEEIKPAMLQLMRGDSEIIQAGRSW